MTLVNLTRTDETKIITTSWLTVEYYKYYKYYHILPFRICSWDVATWDGRGTGGPTTAPPLQFLNQTRPNRLSFKHQGYCFLRAFRNYTNQKFKTFYHVCYNFWRICSSFSFFNYIEETDHFKVELRKSFLLWTIRENTTKNESLNVRS